MNRYSPSSNPIQNSRIFWLTDATPVEVTTPPTPSSGNPFLERARTWLNAIEIRDRRVAHWICRLIPTSCPFERSIRVKGHTVLYIPPLCKFNPCYEEVMGLRFRALCFLADTCQEDVAPYC